MSFKGSMKAAVREMKTAITEKDGDTIYGFRAQNCRGETIKLKLKGLDILSKMRECINTDKTEYESLSVKLDRIIRQMEDVEKRYFG